MRHRTPPAAFLAALWLTFPPPGHAAEQPTPAQARFFETRVRPLLAEHCYACHGPEKQRADLRLDSAERLLEGGASGPALVRGKPEESRLIRAVRHEDEQLRMPPKKKLTDRQVADLTEWVRIGAPYPATKTIAADDGRRFWAFQPPAAAPVPAVKDRGWPRSALDHFVLAALEAKGLKPAPPADKRTLLRRATFDLTGLPPTPEEVDAFLRDDRPDAFAHVVERLLSSPAYGERWGRHWLDVARYADSNGLDENIGHGNAWRYRDWVIAAFNADKPYDAFLVEQLAGDLLPAGDPITRNERLVATGFLSLGPKVLAEVDAKKMEMDIVDEQVDTVGRTFMGLTLGCARCHDHKFDPLPTEDYYALAGVFQSTRTMESFKIIARWHENPLHSPEYQKRKAEHEAKVAPVKGAVEKLVSTANARLKPPLPKEPESLYPKETQVELKRLRDELARLEKEAPVAPTAMGVAEGKVADCRLHVRGSHLNLGKAVPRGVPRVLAGKDTPAFGATASGRLELARWLARPEHPLTARVMVNRLWRWHFGRGLVATTDNFGRLGERLSNPALLDWLAVRFAASGWSVKAMHRLLMLSCTYQMGSAFDERAALADPDNRLHWRFNVRRLEAEAVRDGLLAVGGLLDRKPGGSLLHVKNREFLFDHTSIDRTRYDSPRRSVYLPVIRNNLYDVFQLFDSTDAAVPGGDRATTTVAPQALFMLNSDLVAKASEGLAAGLLSARNADGPGRVARLYATAYGRPPSEKESARALGLVREFEDTLKGKEPDGGKRRLRAWALLCQVVVAANEFIYVR